MKLTPLNNNVIIKKDLSEKKTQGGLFVAHEYDKKNKGVVVAVGRGKYSSAGTIIPMTLKVGDKVLLPDYAGIELEDDCLLFIEDQIIGVIE